LEASEAFEESCDSEESGESGASSDSPDGAAVSAGALVPEAAACCPAGCVPEAVCASETGRLPPCWEAPVWLEVCGGRMTAGWETASSSAELSGVSASVSVSSSSGDCASLWSRPATGPMLLSASALLWSEAEVLASEAR